jgi:hypothetical protein
MVYSVNMANPTFLTSEPVFFNQTDTLYKNSQTDSQLAGSIYR